MFITIAICTWNRSDRLGELLESLEKVFIPDGLDWELIVIDNNCTDDTKEVVASYSTKLPIRLEKEPVQGIASARNRALSESKGEYLIFFDDDMVVLPSTVSAYITAAKKWPTAAFFGGPINVFFGFRLPDYISIEYVHKTYNFFSRKNLGNLTILFPKNETPYGANMMIKKSSCAGFYFDTRVGHVGASRSFGEETFFCQALAEKGATGVWVANAWVNHYFDREDFKLAFFRKNQLAKGRQKGFSEGLPCPKRFSWIHPPTYWMFRKASLAVFLVFQFIIRKPWGETYRKLFYIRGLLEGYKLRLVSK